MKILKLIVLLFTAFFTIANAQSNDSIIDNRDGQVYEIKIIGEQIWMTENLNFKTEGSWCYDNKEENCSLFGRLYSQDAAMMACPTGWHLPADQEWQELEKYLGMPEGGLTKSNAWRGTNQGALLQSDSTIGFNILPGGYRNPPSNYNIKDLQAFFWTATEEGGLVYMRQFYIKNTQVFRRPRPKSWAFSVRCVKD